MSHIVVFWIVKPYSLVVGTNISEENTVSIFRVEDGAVFLSEMLCVGYFTTLSVSILYTVGQKC
jgi:hypothetical protein